MPVSCIQRAGSPGAARRISRPALVRIGGAPTEAAHQVAEADRQRPPSQRGSRISSAGRQPSQRRNRPTSSSNRQGWGPTRSRASCAGRRAAGRTAPYRRRRRDGRPAAGRRPGTGKHGQCGQSAEQRARRRRHCARSPPRAAGSPSRGRWPSAPGRRPACCARSRSRPLDTERREMDDAADMGLGAGSEQRGGTCLVHRVQRFARARPAGRRRNRRRRRRRARCWRHAAGSVARAISSRTWRSGTALLGALRETPTTRAPAACRRQATAAPMKPVTPTTRTVLRTNEPAARWCRTSDAESFKGNLG